MTPGGEKRIRTRSMPHVEDDRLLGRLEYLRANLAELTADESRERFRHQVREIVNVERELVRRGLHFRPVTDGRHLAVDVDDVPTIRPFTRADTAYGR